LDVPHNDDQPPLRAIEMAKPEQKHRNGHDVVALARQSAAAQVVDMNTMLKP